MVRASIRGGGVVNGGHPCIFLFRNISIAFVERDFAVVAGVVVVITVAEVARLRVGEVRSLAV